MNWYDEALYYDVLCGWDPGTEREFVLGASERWGIAQPRRILEPFCGTGRLLRCIMAGRRQFLSRLEYRWQVILPVTVFACTVLYSTRDHGIRGFGSMI